MTGDKIHEMFLRRNPDIPADRVHAMVDDLIQTELPNLTPKQEQQFIWSFYFEVQWRGEFWLN